MGILISQILPCFYIDAVMQLHLKVMKGNLDPEGNRIHRENTLHQLKIKEPLV